MVDPMTLGGVLVVLLGAGFYAWTEYGDDDLDEEVKSEAETVGDADYLGGVKALAMLALLAPLAVLSSVLTALPATWKVYHKLHLWSAYQMQKASSADALANVRHPNDKEDVLPAKYVEGGEEDREATGWKVMGLGSKRYDTGVRGGASSRMGKADLIHLNEDDLEQGTWVEASMDTAIASDREQYLFRDADLEAQVNVIDANGAGAARADGGQQQQQAFLDRVTPKNPGILEDVVVPITSKAGYDGQQVSWNQYQNLKQEKSDQEAVREAKNSGWMAAKLDDVSKRDMLKWALILGAAGAVLLFHQEIGALIAGGGGDAVSSATEGAGLGMLMPFGGV